MSPSPLLRAAATSAGVVPLAKADVASSVVPFGMSTDEGEIPASVVSEVALRGWLGKRSDDRAHAAGAALAGLLLDAVEASAFVMDAKGTVLIANPRGLSHLDAASEELLSFLRTGTVGGEGPVDHDLGTWSRGPLRAWRRWFTADDGSKCALVVVDSEHARVDAAIAAASQAWELTARQGDVLRHVLAGRSNKEVAAALGAATKTIDVHMRALFSKAGVTSRGALVSKTWAVERPGCIGR